MRPPALILTALLLSLPALACSSTTPNPDKTATDIDPERSKPDYWWSQPSPIHLPSDNFDKALAACEHAARERFFTVDRVDARDGLITTYPMTSAQWFEPWRRDNTTAGDVARSSLDSYRRTLRFQIEKATADNRYVITPQVLIERRAVVGRRITTVTGFRNFAYADQSTLSELRAEGRDGTDLPESYWYATGRDHNLELELGKAIVNALH